MFKNFFYSDLIVTNEKSVGFIWCSKAFVCLLVLLQSCIICLYLFDVFLFVFKCIDMNTVNPLLFNIKSWPLTALGKKPFENVQKGANGNCFSQFPNVFYSIKDRNQNSSNIWFVWKCFEFGSVQIFVDWLAVKHCVFCKSKGWKSWWGRLVKQYYVRYGVMWNQVSFTSKDQSKIPVSTNA